MFEFRWTDRGTYKRHAITNKDDHRYREQLDKADYLVEKVGRKGKKSKEKGYRLKREMRPNIIFSGLSALLMPFFIFLIIFISVFYSLGRTLFNPINQVVFELCSLNLLFCFFCFLTNLKFSILFIYMY